MWGGGPGWAQGDVTGSHDPGRPTEPVGPVAPAGARVAARAIDAVVEAAVGSALAILLGLGDRPVAFVAVIWLVATAYETAAATMYGATLGKHLQKLRILGVDTSSATVPLDQAAIRAAASAAALFGPLACVVIGSVNASLVPYVVAIVWLGVGPAATFADPLNRGSVDRAGATMVVPASFSPPLRSRDLPGYADAARPPRVTPIGRVGELDVRSRARLRRLNGAVVLTVVLTLATLAVSLPSANGLTFAIAGAVWLVVFVVDETRRLTGSGTPGHRLAGLVVVDRRTGGPPSTGRAVARAIVLGLTVYVPLLWPVLVISVLLMRTGDEGRGIHDHAGGTVVVADPRIDPETQRRMAMRVRLGRVA